MGGSDRAMYVVFALLAKFLGSDRPKHIGFTHYLSTALSNLEKLINKQWKLLFPAIQQVA